jgi:hypothetical protein
MQPHKQTVQNGNRARLAALFGASLLALGCSPPLAPADDDPDDGEVADVPADLPAESIEYAGILYGLNHNAEPSRFILCGTGEFIEWSFPTSRVEEVHEGSCYGVYHRVRGQLDRHFEPPRLIIDEIVESRWCEPDDCEDAYCEPHFQSCFPEEEVTRECDPLLDNTVPGCAGARRCNPVRFHATEAAGWMHYICESALGEGVAGDACEYGESPDEHIDTCAHGYRCWNADGDTTAPGTCVAYCDVEGELGPVCDGSCLPCSATERGLCMTGCSGDDCRVDDFC